MKFYEKTDVAQMVTAACQREGSQSAWGAKHGLSPAYVSDVISGRRDPGAGICQALGLERRTVFVRANGEHPIPSPAMPVRAGKRKSK